MAAAVTARATAPGRVARLPGVDRSRPAAAGSAGAARVVIADGQALVRAGLRVVLDGDERLRVVGEAASGEEAVALADRLRPDVVLIDAGLPGLGCVEAIEAMATESGVAVMLLIASERDDTILAALRAGAGAVLSKDTEPTQLLRAVEALTQGEALLSPGLTRRLMAELASRPRPSAPGSELIDELTAREHEVLGLVALGFTNEEIADRLTVSVATVKTHVNRAMVKLHAHDRAKLVVLAYETGLVAPRTDPPSPHRRRLSLAS